MTIRHTAGTSGSVRVEQYMGRDHVVVPVVALVEGVINCSNCAGPELALADEFSRGVDSWNGRPVVLGHPTDAWGTAILANDPRVLDRAAIGTVFGARVEGKKLLMEAWIDVQRAEAVGAGPLLASIRRGKIADVSVGVMTVTEPTPGTFAGKSYGGVWRHVVPEHLALLPEGVGGACSISMGCGTRAAMERRYAGILERIPTPPPFYGLRKH